MATANPTGAPGAVPTTDDESPKVLTAAQIRETANAISSVAGLLESVVGTIPDDGWSRWFGELRDPLGERAASEHRKAHNLETADQPHAEQVMVTLTLTPEQARHVVNEIQCVGDWPDDLDDPKAIALVRRRADDAERRMSGIGKRQGHGDRRARRDTALVDRGRLRALLWVAVHGRHRQDGHDRARGRRVGVAGADDDDRD